LHKIAILPFFPPETDDVIGFRFCHVSGLFQPKLSRFRIGNSYHSPLPPAPPSVSPKSSLLDLDYPYLVAGDFNIHNSATNPSSLRFSKEHKESTPYFDRATDLGFTLLNTTCVYT